MPKRKSTRRKTRRRYRRKRLNLYKMSSFQRGPLRQKQVVKHKYAQRIEGNPSLGTIYTWVFSANGMYDPDISGTGNQPIAFDQMTPLYDHYTVIGAKIIVDFAARNEETTNCICGIAIRDTSTTSSNVELYLENPSVKYKMLQSAQGGKTVQRVMQKVSPHKWLGRSKPLTDDELRGNATSNPSETVDFHVFVAPHGAASDPGPIDILVTIQYIAVWTEPRPLSRS